ncbi:MAG: DUF362 domain-containing protein [Anaerolineae bacterium]|nr:DUF362 domain-containing protein [Anaerolineae bacterium]
MPTNADYRVRAVHCDHRASDEEVYAALKRATDPLEQAWAKLERAQRITIKFNQAFLPERLVTFHGRLQELVDPAVARATLRLLRERTNAELRCIEITGANSRQRPAEELLPLMPVMKEFGVPWVDGDRPPLKTYRVPGGGLMFDQYLLHEAAVETDAFVSVQPMKNHAFMGVTLCLKNLFGLPPMEPYGRTRSYFHHIIRLSYVLVDLGRLVYPTLNIIDALVGQSGREWGGEGRICDALVAGDHPIATDACGTHLMGFDPLADWPHQPFVRDRSSLRIAHDHGFGTADLSQIDFNSEVQAPVASFRTEETDPYETVLAWRRSTCEQALYYRDHRQAFVDRYAGEYILLQDGEVRWHSETSDLGASRRDLAGPRAQSALYLKLVDPEEAEGEHFEVYEGELARLDALG